LTRGARAGPAAEVLRQKGELDAALLEARAAVALLEIAPST
jgi:hypothetical protein